MQLQKKPQGYCSLGQNKSGTDGHAYLRMSDLITDREEVWDSFGQADKHMVYGNASDYLEVTLEHKDLWAL